MWFMPFSRLFLFRVNSAALVPNCMNTYKKWFKETEKFQMVIRDADYGHYTCFVPLSMFSYDIGTANRFDENN